MKGRGGGGYVGGFLQMFDWNSKSRKKLFASKSDFLIPDQSKQKKRAERHLPTTQFDRDDEEEDEAATIMGGGYSCSSSVINEEDDHGNGIKAPNVVARLMGLDSLPTTNFEESNLEEGKEKPISLGYKQEKDDNLVHRAINKQQTPIEKFQTEILPRKTAKSIPITQNKLLSPIKSPSFVPSYKDAAQIMEAVSKIIEPALQANSTSKKVIKLQLPSVPLKTKDLKEKAAAAASIGGSRTRMRSCSNFNSDSDKEKSVSLAVQAKVNVQRREGISRQSSNNISIQPNKSNTTQKKKTSSTVVLRQNNQKQNCRPTEKDNNYKSTSHGRRRSLLTLDDSSSNSSSKVSSRKFNHDDEDDKQSVSSSSSSITKTVFRKKQLIATDTRNDIVSFTFSAPMMISGITTPMAFEKTGDLTALLEQKLREITNIANSCKHNSQDREMDLSGTSRTKLRELEYVNEILSGFEVMIEDYAIGRSKRIINPHLFHQIESPIRGEDQSMKLLFDCVGESMELRCMSGKGWKTALSFGKRIRRRKTLAEEVYGEISGWRDECIGKGKGGKEEEDRMVDYLVDRDMSSRYGKWLDFEIETFQIGVEIQGRILNTLINQVIADMIASGSSKL